MADESIIDFLLYTKLNRPPIGRNHIQRSHLLEQFNKRRQRPLTLVSAPASYGKNPLVFSWLEANDNTNAQLKRGKVLPKANRSFRHVLKRIKPMPLRRQKVC